MSKLTFSVTQLRAALLCAAKSDIRYYLNGVYIETNNKTTRMCGTNGHYLLAIDYDHGDKEGGYVGNFIVPREVCEIVCKGKYYVDFGTIEITDIGDKCVSGNIQVQDTCILFKSVQGVFPTYSRVIVPWVGDDTAMVAGHYNTEYLGTFAKVAKLLGSKLGLFTLWQRGQDSALVTFSSQPDNLHAIGVLMPINCMGKRGESLNIPRTTPFQSVLPVEQVETTQGEAFGA